MFQLGKQLIRLQGDGNSMIKNVMAIFVIDTDYNKKEMDRQSSDVSAKILLQVKDAFMHRYINNKKSLFTSGNFKIAKIDHNNGSTIYFINMNSFYYTLRKQIVFVKIPYEHSVAYLFPHFQNGLSAISLPNNSPSIHDLEQVLTNAAVLTDYTTAMNDSSIRNKIETHSKNIANQPAYNPDNVKETINNTGKLLNNAFSLIGGLVKQGVSKAGQFISTKLEPTEGSQVNPETKQKWENIKKGGNNLLKMSLDTYNSYLDPYVKPVVQKGKQELNSIKEKINSSENENVKYARELAETTQKALGQAFEGLVKSGKQVGEEFSTQTKKIVQKKLGDDYVKTFIEGEPGQQEQQGYKKLEQEEPSQETEQKLEYPDLEEAKKC